MATFTRLSVPERILLFLFEKSPEWADRMILDDQRLQALSEERGARPSAFSATPGQSANNGSGAERTSA